MEASVLVMRCGLRKHMFGVRIQKMEDGDWYRTWAFKLNEKRAKNEGYEMQSVSGNLFRTEGFPGCPYCGSYSFYQCGTCRKIVCWNGKDMSVTCPWCNTTDTVVPAVDKFKIDTGEF